MRPEDILISAAIASALTLTVLTLRAYRVPLARGLRSLIEELRWFNPRHVNFAVIFALLGVPLTCAYLDRHSDRSVYFVIFSVVVAFTVAWVREFLFLMSLRDEDLPGRFDKPIWAFLLIFLAPAGLLLFRSHRLAHWPEPEPKPKVAKDVARELA